MRGLIRVMPPVFLILVVGAACQRDSSGNDAAESALPPFGWFILVVGSIFAVMVVVYLGLPWDRWLLNYRTKKSARRYERKRSHSIKRNADRDNQTAVDIPWSVLMSKPVDNDDGEERKWMTEWHYKPITQREADIIESEMSSMSGRKKRGGRAKAQRDQDKVRRSRNNASTRSVNDSYNSSQSSTEDDAASDAMKFQRLFEQLARLAPRELPPAERDERIAARTSTTSGEIRRLRSLRNKIAHDNLISIADVRKKTERIEGLLRNAANQRESSP